MNINEKIIKVIIAVVIVLGASIWIFTTVRPKSYEGVNLEFPINRGVVQVTNDADAVEAQLISSGSRTFRVSSPSDGISGASGRQDSDEGRIQVYDFVLPSGMSEFTVSSGSDVRFEATASPNLSVTVYSLSAEAIRIRLIALAVLVVVVLFYISQLYDHLWISAARRQDAKDDIVTQEAEQDNFDRIMKSRSSKKRP